MYKTVLDYLNESVNKYKDRISFCDSKEELTYEKLSILSKKIGTVVCEKKHFKKGIAILLDKSVSCIVAMLGVLYSGNYYTVLDTKSPKERLNSIIETLDPECIITDDKYLTLLNELNFRKDIINVDKIDSCDIDEELLSSVYSKVIDTDTMYVLFTSGSTGVPKGTVLSHRAVISYIEWFSNCFNINSDTVFGSQTPFYFSMSVSDIFSTIKAGASFYMIPKMYFSFPIKLLDFLNEKKINTIYWVPSALSIVANMKALDEIKLPYLKKVLFAGEVMPTKQLNMWIDKVDAEYANLYGPTETVDICTYYKVNRKLKNDESVPIGVPCNNTDIIILNEKNKLCGSNEPGELCVRGSFLADGYYKNIEKTNEVFVQNPLNECYPEKIYKTGDIVKYNEFGEIVYISRKDYQIKHMGYRIELGEIETKISSIEGIILCASIYDKESDKIILYYQSDEIGDILLLEQAKKILPKYMVPNVVIKLDRFYYNANGKIDRKKLMSEYLKR